MGQKVSASSGGGDFKILDAGTFPAVCTMVVGIGPQRGEWQGKEKIQDKVKIRFEVPSERFMTTYEAGEEIDGGPMVIWATYTASLADRAKLRKHLESWRGKEFTVDELESFDLDNIIGKPCMIAVVHNTASNGRTYANVDSISKLMKGIDPPKPEGDVISFEFEDHTKEEFDALPEWLQNLVSDGKKLQAELSKDVPQESENPAPPGEEDGFYDDDLPF